MVWTKCRRVREWILAAMLACAGGMPVSGQEFPWPQRGAEPELLTEVGSIEPGGVVVVGVRFSIQPGWHLYWTNPGKVGFPLSATWSLPEGFRVEGLRFPVPKRFFAAGAAGFGYEEEVIFPVELRVPESWPTGKSFPVEATLDWLMCDAQTCVPGDEVVSGEVRVVPDGSEPGWMGRAMAKMPERVDWPLESTLERGRGRVVIRIEDGGAAGEVSGADFFLAQRGIIDAAAEVTMRREREGEVLRVELPLAEGFEGRLPRELGGLLVGAEGAAAYSIGVVSVDGSAGAEAAGEGAEGWGYWLQKPFLVMLLSGLMLGIALNLFGVFEIGTGLSGVGGGLLQREGLAGSYFSGALATILGTPCTAPFMGSAIAYALGQPAIVTLLVFTFLGLGMASPYLILSSNPALMKRLPRPGAWMETFKQAMAFPMLAVLGALTWVLAHQVTENGLLLAFVAYLALALGAWWFGRFDRPGHGMRVRWVARGAGVVLVLFALWTMASGAGREKPLESIDVEARVAELQGEGKRVFVDFTAAWCATCQANKAAMHADTVERAFEQEGVAFLEVDWTRRDPAILRVLQKYGREGVPLYLLFPAEVGGEPIVLPNVLTEGIILDAVRDGKGGQVTASTQVGLIAALFGAFVGGLILNLMPCVFPVISLKIMSFVKQGGEAPARVRQHGYAFALGALSFFWFLAIVLLAARSTISS